MVEIPTWYLETTRSASLVASITTCYLVFMGIIRLCIQRLLDLGTMESALDYKI
jgi:hypothetical protein